MKINTLENGIKVVTDKNDYALSATIGVWFRVGAVDESDKISGISHFIEHMMFKGTKDRTARDIAFEMDSVGGSINAFTSKECTCYNATVTYEHLGKAVVLLADMVKNSLIDQGELDKERGVILEEINMVEDSPEDVIHCLHSENFFNGSSVSNSVIGTKETVSGLNSPDLKKYISENYTTDRLVVSVAGKFDEEELIKLIAKEFGSGFTQKGKGHIYDNSKAAAKKDGNIAFKNMPIEQTHICLGFPGLKLDAPNLYDLYVFNDLFGGSMSSRLFQKIREEKALCYTVYSYASPYMNTGVFTIYSATNKNQVKDLVALAMAEISSIIKEGATKEEVEMAKEQMKGNYILGVESTSGRMSSLGRSLLLTGQAKTPETVIDKINSVSLDSMMETIRALINFDNMTASFVGNVDLKECKSFIN